MSRTVDSLVCSKSTYEIMSYWRRTMVAYASCADGQITSLARLSRVMRPNSLLPYPKGRKEQCGHTYPMRATWPPAGAAKLCRDDKLTAKRARLMYKSSRCRLDITLAELLCSPVKIIAERKPEHVVTSIDVTSWMSLLMTTRCRLNKASTRTTHTRC
jgi:hypothetical protein